MLMYGDLKCSLYSTGATGSFWAHDKWNLKTPPDFVTFRCVHPAHILFTVL